MYSLRRLEEKDFIVMADIVGNAYPDFNITTKEEKDRLIENSIKIQNERPDINFFGAFDKETMVGSMRFHDFKMNMLSTEITAGGIGLVAVDLLHKKEKVAKEMVEYYLNHYKAIGATMALLYPFRPDFYKSLGFGFGTSINQFKVKPSNLPNAKTKEHLVYLKPSDAEKMCECYNRYYKKTNGLIEKYVKEFENIFKNPALKVIGYKENDEINGYLIFEFKQKIKEQMLVNNIVVNYFIYENTNAFDEIMTFLHTQDDQICQVIFNTQDENFRFLLNDPRDGSENLFTPVYHQTNLQGTGIMYRVLDVRKLFEELKSHNFNNVSCKLKLTIKDNLLSDNNDSFIIEFTNGFPEIITDDHFDTEIILDICDFSSLITCTVSLKSLIKYRRATISDDSYLNTVNSLFSSCEKPLCLTQF